MVNDEWESRHPVSRVLHSAFIIPHSAFIAMPIASRDVVVSNKVGLHARPAMQFVDVANEFTSDITVRRGGEDPLEVDGKSVMQMITLEAVHGTPLKILARGDDAQAAVDRLAELFESKFGEE
jgi:phosphocarrier protein HPr